MKIMVFLLFALTLLVNIGCQSKTGGMLQVSTLNALYEGEYDGLVTLKQMRTFGDMGLGTYHRLDGTMVLINGDFYHINGNGTVTIPHDTQTTPFAIATRFVSTIDRKFQQPRNFNQLKGTLDKLVPDKNVYCFFYIRGQFSRIHIWNYYPQRKPYPPLREVKEALSVSEFKDIYGTLVGVRVPPYLSGINTPGYTFYFLNEARNNGGEVQDAVMSYGHIRIDTQHQWFHLELPYL